MEQIIAMTFDPEIHHRRSIRLRGYDYAGGGAYFVTICTQNKYFLFGEIVEDEMILTEQGRIVQRIWHNLPSTFPAMVLDAFQMMPNHLHGVFVLPGPGLSQALALATGTSVVQPTPDQFVGRTNGNDPHRQYSQGIVNTGIVGAGLALPPSPDATRAQAIRVAKTGAGETASRGPTRRRTSMGDVVGGFKSICTIALNKFMTRPGARPLQENFYEHIVRDTHELELIREYVVQNPQRWRDDPERL
jgi:putative transposase